MNHNITDSFYKLPSINQTYNKSQAEKLFNHNYIHNNSNNHMHLGLNENWKITETSSIQEEIDNNYMQTDNNEQLMF